MEKRNLKSEHFYRQTILGEVPMVLVKESCRCGWVGDRSELIYESDIERNHPKNINNPNRTPHDKSQLHYTKFEKCPLCDKCIFADGDRLFLRPPRAPQQATRYP